MRYVALLRGINVGGKNLIRMPDLAEAFSTASHTEVQTYIQSGNVVFTGDAVTEEALEVTLLERFKMAIPVLLRSRDEFAATVAQAPAEFADPNYRSDVLFLKAPLTADEVLEQLPRINPDVDKVWPGPGALYFARLDALRTKSRLSAIISTPIYQQMSVRNWNTTRKLLELADG